MLTQEVEDFLAKGGVITEIPPVDLDVARRILADSFNQELIEDEPDEEEDEDIEVGDIDLDYDD